MRDMDGDGLSSDKLAAALENFGSFVGKLTAAVEKVFPTLEHVLARIHQSFPALFGLLRDQASRIPAALRSVEQSDGGPDGRPDQEPRNANAAVLTGHILPPDTATSIVSRYAENMA